MTVHDVDESFLVEDTHTSPPNGCELYLHGPKHRQGRDYCLKLLLLLNPVLRVNIFEPFIPEQANNTDSWFVAVIEHVQRRRDAPHSADETDVRSLILDGRKPKDPGQKRPRHQVKVELACKAEVKAEAARVHEDGPPDTHMIDTFASGAAAADLNR